MQKHLLILCFVIFNYQFNLAQNSISPQTTLHDVDTTNGFGKDLLGFYKKFNHIKFSGYLQPQYQFTDTLGVKNYSGGDFATNSNNRFMLRRGRLRVDYAQFTKENKPKVFLVFQFDGSERGLVTRDFWGRFFENKFECFALSAGIMARPFSAELLNGSGDRESPERARVSQIHTRTERDLGIMLTFEPRKKTSKLKFLKWDLMIGNGQGLTSTSEYDNFKDLINRVSIKPQKVGKMNISGAIGVLYGGIRQSTALSYKMKNRGWQESNKGDDIGQKLPRQYYQADIQIKIPNKKGNTEFRAEYLTGWQTATSKSNETPSTLPVLANGAYEPLFTRPFNAAIFYYLQHLGSPKHQIIVKYDWYDPNTQVSKLQIDKNYSLADIKFNTLGIGYTYYMNANLKIVTYYEWVKNEKTAISNYNRDLKDNIFTTRLQFKF